MNNRFLNEADKTLDRLDDHLCMTHKELYFLIKDVRESKYYPCCSQIVKDLEKILNKIDVATIFINKTKYNVEMGDEQNGS